MADLLTDACVRASNATKDARDTAIVLRLALYADTNGFGRAAGCASFGGEDESRAFYLASDVERIRALPPIVDPIRWRGGEPCARWAEWGERRRREVIAAHEARAAALAAAEARSGYGAACRRCDTATTALLDIEERVDAVPARSLAGLVAKARVVVACAERAESDDPAVAFAREVAAFEVPA